MKIFSLLRPHPRLSYGWLMVLLITSLAPASVMAQSTLSAGDVAFVGFNGADDQTNGVNSNDKFAFVLLKDVSANTKIFFTDFGWLTGGGFQPNWQPNAANGTGSKSDGILVWTASGNVAAGTQVVIQCKYNLSASTGTVAGVEKIAAGTSAERNYYMDISDGTPDNIFAYQAASGRAANPTLLAGIRTRGSAATWDASLTATEFTPSKTTLPASLTANGVNAALYLQGFFYTTAIYTCTLSNGSPKTLRNAINTKANWTYPNPGTPCEGYFYAPNDPDCPQSSIPAGYDLPINCSFTVQQVLITGQPSDRTVCSGLPVSFSVTAQNATSYQWQVSTNSTNPFTNLSNGGIYSGVTSTTLTIASTTGLNGYRYRVIASDPAEPASVTSSAATLTVNSVPQNVTVTPSGLLNCTTSTITLTGSSTGGNTYVFSGPGVVTQSGSTATVNQAGMYTVVVTTASSCSASATTIVSSDYTFAATASASAASAVVGSVISLSATGGTGYQWTAPAGTSLGNPSTNSVVSATLTSPGVQTFTVLVSNGTCSQTLTVGVTATNPADLTPIIYVRPASVHGTTDISAVVDVVELNNVATTGPITIMITKDASLDLNFDSNQTIIGGRSVSNSSWQLDNSNASYYILSTSQLVPGGGQLSVGLSGKLTPGGTKGLLSISVTVDGGSGGEIKLNNNTDVDTLEYFQL